MTIHKPRIKYSDELHLPQNTITLNRISDKVLITTETWNGVKDPWTIQNSIVADNGYVWIKKWEIGKNYSPRKTYNQDGELVSIYIDICSPITVKDDTFEFEDWYLDIWQDVKNNKNPIFVDENEFNMAVEAGYLTTEFADKTKEVSEHIINGLREKTFLDF